VKMNKCVSCKRGIACNECTRRHCPDHAWSSVSSFDDGGNLVVESSTCVNCKDKALGWRGWTAAVKERLGIGVASEPHPAMTVVKSKPLSPAMEAWKTVPRVFGGNLEISITPECYANMMAWRIDELHNEIAGFAVVVDDEIVWTVMSDLDKHSGASVESNSGQASIEALLAGFDPPNLQWHTHPGMGSYFSGTDDTDQAEFAFVAAKISAPRPGHCYFVCYDSTDWSLRKVSWENGKVVSREDGSVTLLGVDMSERKSKWASKYSTGTVVWPKPASELPATTGGYNWNAYTGWANWKNDKQPDSVVSTDTGEIIDDTPLDYDQWDDLDEYFTHFGVKDNDWSEVCVRAEICYGPTWDWDLTMLPPVAYIYSSPSRTLALGGSL